MEARKENGDFFYDFGKHAFAILEIHLIATKEEKITVAIGEVLSGKNQIERNPGGSRIYREEQFTVLEGENSFMMKVSHPGYNDGTLTIDPDVLPFRYAEVRGCSSACVHVIQQAYFGTFEEDASCFKSTNVNLNKVWDLCKYTMKATTPFGVFIDGNRERQAYEGDDYINQLSYFVCMADFEIARNTIDRLFQFPTWPTEWQLAMIPIVCDYFLYSGDEANVRRWYSPLKRKCLLELADDSGLIAAENLDKDWYCPGFGKSFRLKDIVDWPQPERDHYEFGRINLVPNCWHYMALTRMAELAGMLKEPADQKFYQAAAAKSRAIIRKTMLKNGLFVDNPDSSHTSLHSCVFPVLWNIAEESEKPRMLELMKSKGMVCSVFVAQFLLECCCRNHMADYALELITSEGPRSWMNMIRRGATITMESWDDCYKPNQDWNHPWGAAPANIIVRELIGLKPTAPGFSAYECKPALNFLPDLTLKTPTIKGEMVLEIQDGHYKINGKKIK